MSCTGYLVLSTKWMYGSCPWISTTRHMSLYVLGYTHCGIGLCIVVQLFSTCSLSLEHVVWAYLCSSMLYTTRSAIVDHRICCSMLVGYGLHAVSAIMDIRCSVTSRMYLPASGICSIPLSHAMSMWISVSTYMLWALANMLWL